MKNQSNPHIGIILDLDAILDTRLAAIELTHPELAEEVKVSASYYLRKDDMFNRIHPDLNNALIHLRLQRPDEELVRKSKVTMVLRYLLDTINDIITRGRSGDPENTGIFLVLNVHPYNLSEDVITRIASALCHQLGYSNLPIAYIDKPLGEITPDFLKESNIYHWYCYNFQSWMQATLTDSNDVTTLSGYPELKMYCPRISMNSDEIEGLYDELKEELDFDEFAWTKAAFANYVNLNFMNVSTFSKLDVDKLVKLEDGGEMERKEAVSVLFEVTREMNERIGLQSPKTEDFVNKEIDGLIEALYKLRSFNTEKGLLHFRKGLATSMLQMVNIYNNTPFNPADDLEVTIDAVSLAVDTNEEQYLETEKHYNDLGIRTIKREVSLGSEKIYRCVVAEEVEVDGVVYKEGSVLTPIFKQPKRATFPAIDDLQFSNYFKQVI